MSKVITLMSPFGEAKEDGLALDAASLDQTQVIGVEKIHGLVQVGRDVLGVAPGLSEFFHFVKVWTVCKGPKYGCPPRMLRGCL
jgi:hypothetical protein